jgi:ribosomal protein L11 methyltransferase
MSWLSVSFEVPAADVEAVTEALLGGGALSVDVQDAAAGSPQEEAIFDEAGAAGTAWRRNVVSALVPDTADCATIVSTACARAGIAPPPHRARPVADQDWVRATQAQFAPVQISPRLWITPSWRRPPVPDAVNIVLDPGIAFGTGTHPTTQLCLRWLESAVRGGESVIDYGCGSGVLAIAALKLGAASAVGIDVDGQALLAARRNAMQNRVHARFLSAAHAAPRPAQIVIANILAHPLIVLSPLLAKLTAPHGRLALSGILEAQAEEVCAAYSGQFRMGVAARDEGWVLLAGARR